MATKSILKAAGGLSRLTHRRHSTAWSPSVQQKRSRLGATQETLISLTPPATPPATSKKDGDSALDTAASENVFAQWWDNYCVALDESPIPVKSATSFFGFLIGDLCAQSIVGADYDAIRTLRMVLFGVLMDGPIGHVWYTSIDRFVLPTEPNSPKAVVIKTMLDQLAWAPFFTCVFIAFIDLLKGHPAMIVYSIRAKLGKTLIANYALWPLAHLINFRFVPSKQRILYINAVSICWTSYLSYLLCSKGH